jgi:peptidoglycan/xylan/chitin deacetylase (PgdA/CDA1 family)/2-polyprenyl-3-methyl-5-hydroxy-6-metoxy-1,4-benzoquinol methylase
MASLPLTIGATHKVIIEITEPIPDIIIPARVERILCTLFIQGEYLGTLSLPACDEVVPSYILSDAIARDFAWQILGHFFRHTVYKDLRIESLWKNERILAGKFPEDNCEFWSQLHDRIGWTVFLQEIWALPDWSGWQFYDPHNENGNAIRRRVEDWLAIELSEDLPDLEIFGKELNVLFSVGGIALGIVKIPAEKKFVCAQEIRSRLIKACGFELCRAAVREGLLGKTISDPISIRDRLAKAATQMRGINQACKIQEKDALAPGSIEMLKHFFPSVERCIVIPRRIEGAIGTTISRRAVLPVSIAKELIEMASNNGEAVIQVPELSERPSHVIYAPDIILLPFQARRLSIPSSNTCESAKVANMRIFGRHYFETRFALKTDPWGYTNLYEQKKYEQTLEMLPSVQFGRALELACAEGHFTEQLAHRVNQLIAADISQIALDRAARRCSRLENVSFIQLDMTKDPLPGRFDLIVCSEVLYFIGNRDDLRSLAQRFADALEPGGFLITAHANLLIDEPDKPGFDWDNVQFGAKVIGEVLKNASSLRLVKELRTPLYRIHLFRRDNESYSSSAPNTPIIIELAQQPMQLPPEVEEHVRWHGGNTLFNCAKETVVTEYLPILVYHRISSTGPIGTAPWRVTPEAFEEQLRYLRDAGYYSIKLEDWRAAVEAHMPLPGQAVLITFDDGYIDFLTQAWPLLIRYGFSATIFLVGNEIGGTNKWDSCYDEKISLLGLEEITHLREEGVEFGSHSVTHRNLTALSNEDIVLEGARSRDILQRCIGNSINAFAYPYGQTDQVIQHLIGACGYIFGLTCNPGKARLQDSLIALPRIEVLGSDGLEDFVRKLNL